MPDQLEQFGSNRNGADVSGLNLLDLLKADNFKSLKPYTSSEQDNTMSVFFRADDDDKTDPKGETKTTPDAPKGKEAPKGDDAPQVKEAPKVQDAPKPAQPGAPVTGNADIVFFHFNDMHSTGLMNGDVATMTETMKERIDQAHKDGKFVVVVFAGDEAGGNTVASNAGKGLVENQVLQKMKELTGQEIFQVIGNHAADGAKDIKHLVGVAGKTGGKFSVSNLEFPGAPDAIGQGKNFEKFQVAEAKGPNGTTLKVGIVGLTTVEYTAEASGVRLKYETLVGMDAAEIAKVAKDLNKAVAENPENPKAALPAFDAEANKGMKDPLAKFRNMTAEELKLRAAEFKSFVTRSEKDKIGLSEGNKFSYNDAYIHAACDTIAEMKAQGIDKIVIASHLGLAVDLEVAKHVPDVSLIIGAHSHDAVAVPKTEKNVRTGKEVAVVQAGCKAQFLGETHVSYKGNNGEKGGQEYEVKGKLHKIDEIRNSKAPGELSDKMKAYIATLHQDGDPTKPLLQRTIGDIATSPKFGADKPEAPLKAAGNYSDANLRKGESCLGNLTADALRCALNDYIAQTSTTPGKPAPLLNGFLNHMGGVRNGISEGAALDGVKLCDVFCTGNVGGELVVSTMTPKMLKDVLEFGVHDFPEPGKGATHDYSGNFLSPSGIKVEYDSTELEGAKYVKAADAKDAETQRQGKRITKISVLDPATNKYEVVWDAKTMTPEDLAKNTRELKIGTRAHAIEKWAKNGVFSDPARYPEFKAVKEAAIKQLQEMGIKNPNAKQVHELAGFKLLGVDSQVKLVNGGWVSTIDITQPEALGKYLNGKTKVAADIPFEKGAAIKPEKVGGLDGRFVDVNAAPPKPEAKPASTPVVHDGELKKAQPELVKVAVSVEEPRHEKAPTVKDKPASSVLPEVTIVGDGVTPGTVKPANGDTKSSESVEREKVERAARQVETRRLERKLSGNHIDHLIPGKGFDVVNAEGKVVTVKGIRKPLGQGEVSYLVQGDKGLVVDAELTKTVKERLSQNETLKEALKDANKSIELMNRYAQVSQDVQDNFGVDSKGTLIDYRAVAESAQKSLGKTAITDGTMVRFMSEAGIPMVVKFKPEEGKKAEVRSWNETELTDDKLAKLVEVMKIEDREIREQLTKAMKDLLKNRPEAIDFESCKTELAKAIRDGSLGKVTDELREVFKSFGVEFENGKPKFENGSLVLRPKTTEGTTNKTQGHAGPGSFERFKGKAVPIMMIVLAVGHQSQERQSGPVIKN